MGIIARYVIGETLRIFVLAVVSTVLLMTLAGSILEGTRHGLPPHVIFQAMPYVLPDMLQFILPGCMLFAVCAVFGCMAANNEILAIKSIGLSPLRCMLPVIALSIVLSAVAFVNQDARARSRSGLSWLIFKSFVEVAYGVLKVEHSFKANGISIIAKKLVDDKLIDVVVMVDRPSDGTQLTLQAEQMALSVDNKLRALRLVCQNGRLELPGQTSLSFGDSFVHHIPLDHFAPNVIPEHAGASSLPTWLIADQISQQSDNIAREAGVGAATGARPRLQDLSAGLRVQYERLFRLQAEVPRRMANAFACCCFTMIGIPVAIWWKSADIMSVFAFCFLPILLVYYPLLVVGEMVARQGVLPQYSPWLADTTLMIAGLGLTAAVMRK